MGSCPVLPHRAISGLDHSGSQGWTLEATGQRVPLPLPSTPGLRWGGPQSHSGKGSRGRSSLGPHKAGSPTPTPGPPQEAQSNSWQAPKPTFAFHLPNPFLWPSPCDFGPWFSFQIGGFQEALQGSDTGYLPCGQLQALCLSSLSGRAPSWAEGPGAGPRVQPSSCSFPSLNSINLSTPLLWE